MSAARDDSLIEQLCYCKDPAALPSLCYNPGNSAVINQLFVVPVLIHHHPTCDRIIAARRPGNMHIAVRAQVLHAAAASAAAIEQA